MIDWLFRFSRAVGLARRKPLSAPHIPAYRPSPDSLRAYGKRSGAVAGPRVVCYTAVMGEYGQLLAPEVVDVAIDYICFSDRPRYDFGVWQVRNPPYGHSDPRRMARYVKTHPHDLFPEYDAVVWIDANIVVCGDLQRYIALVKSGASGLGLIVHPHHDSYVSEAEKCIRKGKGERSLLKKQVRAYRKAGLKENGLYETGFMVALMHDERLRRFFRLWWDEIEAFSSRDQIALAWVLERMQFPVTKLLPEGMSVRDDCDFKYFSHKATAALEISEEYRSLGRVQCPSGIGKEMN